MAIPELGAKQICPHCQSKFYDLTRRPAVCPKCGTEFDPEEALKTRRVRVRSAAPDYEDEPAKPVVRPEAEADGYEDEADDTPEIDQVAAEPVEADEDADDVGGVAPPADDLGVDFVEEEELEEDSDDVPFLEDDDDDDFDEDIEVPGEDE